MSQWSNVLLMLTVVVTSLMMVSQVSGMPPDFLWGQKRTGSQLESPKMTKSDMETVSLAACRLCQTLGLSQEDALECEMGSTSIRDSCFKKIFRAATGQGGGAYGR